MIKEELEKEILSKVMENNNRILYLDTACDMTPETEAKLKQIREQLREPTEAQWIPVSTKPGVHAGMKCSLCKARISYSEYYGGNHNYCHKCGAKMIKES